MDELENLFCELVPVKYGFLIDEFHFTLIQEKTWRYCALSSHCRVVMEYEKNHFACWIEKINPPNGSRDFFSGVNVMLIAAYKEYNDFTAEHRFDTKDKILTREIDGGARMLKDYCSPFLKGDFSDWSKLVEWLKEYVTIKKQEWNDRARKWKVQSIREQAAIAWKNKDYSNVISFYESINDLLSKTERKKVEYSKKRLQRNY